MVDQVSGLKALVSVLVSLIFAVTVYLTFLYKWSDYNHYRIHGFYPKVRGLARVLWPITAVLGLLAAWLMFSA